MKVTWAGADYEVADERIIVWEHQGKWRGMIKHSDGSDGTSLELVGASDAEKARQMLTRR